MRASNHLAVTAVVLFAAGGPAVFAESEVSMPQIGGIDSPTMPTVTSPTIGDGFYTPGNDGNDIYTGPASTTSTKKDDSSKETENKGSQTDGAAASANTNSTASKSTAASTTATSATSILSSLSAGDISSLDDMGLLSQLFSTTGTENSTANISNLYTSTSDSNTNILLKQVLAELEGLKAQNAQTADSAKGSTASTASKTTTTAAASTTNYSSNSTKALRSQLIRFLVNGYDILKTCRMVYISKVEKDSTFLLTGDRRYQSDGATRSETFYLLFKSKGVINGQQTYSVAAAVTQDYLNQYSFLYQLSQKSNLTATQVGNLVCLRTTDPSWKLDLLLDLEQQ